MLSSTAVEAGILDDIKNLSFGGGGSGAGVAPPQHQQLNAQMAQQLHQQQPQQHQQQQMHEMEVQPRMQHAAPGVEAGAESFEQMDLNCVNNPWAQLWFTVQQKMRYTLPPEAAFGQVGSREILEPALYSIMEDMNALPDPNLDVCGVGKLAVQLLSLIATDDNGGNIAPLLRNEKVTSPILTLLLDVPWSVYQPSWPLFGIYAQMSMRRLKQTTNPASVDGLESQEMMVFANAINDAIMEGNLARLRELAGAFLETGNAGVSESPFAFLTCIFMQAATTDNKTEAQELFFTAQTVMKKMIHNAEEFDMTLSTRWPLWGFAYLASLQVV